MSNPLFSGASPPRKVAEYASIAAYRTGEGMDAPQALATQMQPGDVLMVMLANGVRYTELWRNGQKVSN